MLVKFIKKCLVFIYILVFLVLVALQSWFQVAQTGFSVSSLIYWMILVGWLFSIWNFKLRSSFSLKIAFALFVVAVLFTTLGLVSVGEPMMRVSFIGWMAGVVQAFIEYNKGKNRKL